MKPIHLFTVVGFLFFISTATAQITVKKEDVPEAVITNCKEKFPDIKVHSWQMEDGYYEGVCKSDGKKTELVFDGDGKYISTKTHVKKDEVPTVVMAGLNSTSFTDWKMHDVEFVETSNHKSFYEIAMKKGNMVEDLVFDVEGNQLAKK